MDNFRRSKEKIDKFKYLFVNSTQRFDVWYYIWVDWYLLNN